MAIRISVGGRGGAGISEGGKERQRRREAIAQHAVGQRDKKTIVAPVTHELIELQDRQKEGGVEK